MLIAVKPAWIGAALLARVAVGPERDVLWAAVVKNNPGYARYQDKTPREIPVVVCEPTS